MTTVGKIFAVFTMLMSLLVCGLIVVWYAKSTPYARAYTEASQKLKGAYDSTATSYAEVQKAKQEAKAELAKAEDTIKKLQDDIEALRNEVSGKKQDLAKLANEKTEMDAQVKSLQTQASKRQIDADQLRLALEKVQKDNLNLVKENDKYR